jgi:hypothetical protein
VAVWRCFVWTRVGVGGVVLAARVLGLALYRLLTAQMV